MVCGDSTNSQSALTTAGVESSDIRISKDNCGSYFLTAPMTEEQVGKVLESAKGAIKAIVSDDHITSDGISRLPMPGRRKKNRRNGDRLITVKQAPKQLHYISAPWAMEIDYVYPENAGQSINGFMLVLADDRMTSTNREFTTENIIKAYIDALVPAGTLAGNDYTPPVPGSALSLVSLVGGERFGVIKKASLTLIRIAPTTSSFLDGLKKLKERLENPLPEMYPVRTQTVVMTPIGFQSIPLGTDRTNEEEALELVRNLIDQFQVVFLCAAGDIKVDLDGTRVTEPYQWPANWASRQDAPPIITVGGVDMGDGEIANQAPGYYRLPGSVSGQFVSMYAPYFVFANFGDGSTRSTGGTGCSTAMTMGLAMDFLSRPDVRNELNLNENEAGTAPTSTADKMRDYMWRKSYARVPNGPNIIWNGLGNRLGNTGLLPP